MGVSSCSEELDSQPMESYPEGGEPLDVVCKEYGISDYEDIELLSYYKNNLEADSLRWFTTASANGCSESFSRL